MSTMSCMIIKNDNKEEKEHEIEEIQQTLAVLNVLNSYNIGNFARRLGYHIYKKGCKIISMKEIPNDLFIDNNNNTNISNKTSISIVLEGKGIIVNSQKTMCSRFRGEINLYLSKDIEQAKIDIERFYPELYYKIEINEQNTCNKIYSNKFIHELKELLILYPSYKRYEFYPPILLASSNGFMELLSWLLENGSTLNEKSNNGDTPLIKATRKGHIETMKWLWEKVNENNLQDNYENSLEKIYKIALKKGYNNIIKWTLDNGLIIDN